MKDSLKVEKKKTHFWMTWNQAHPYMTELYMWGAWTVFFETRICRLTHSQTLSDIHLTLHYLFVLAYLCSNPLSDPAHTHSMHRAAGLSFESLKFHRPWTKKRKIGVKGRELRNTAKVITWFCLSWFWFKRGRVYQKTSRRFSMPDFWGERETRRWKHGVKMGIKWT